MGESPSERRETFSAVLILRIQNFDQLADGGPISFRADRRGFDIGREQHLDWTLPDPTRHISGKHCEIRFQDGGYWLHDTSSNGTFVNRSDRRVQGPYLLANGDELAIGDYVISVEVQLPGQPAAAAPRGASSVIETQPTGDLWSSPTQPPPPINRRDLMPEQQRSSRTADFLNSIADMPPAPPHDSWPVQPPAAAAGADLWAPTGVRAPAPPRPAPPQEWANAAEAPQQGGYSMVSVARDVPFAAPAAPRPQPSSPRAAAPVEPARPVAAPAQPPEQVGALVEAEFLRQFAAGAGIAEQVLAGRRAGELAFELGGLMRLISANLMHLLKVRAETKGMVRSAERTMIQFRDNNALKFTPSAEAALSIIFGPPAAGYLDKKQTFERAFADILAHEEATFAAMQQAVQDLLADLSPEAVEGNSGSVKISFLGNAKSRNWETFVERWTAKAAAGDNGMLDAFLDLFAAYYDQISSKRKQ